MLSPCTMQKVVPYQLELSSAYTLQLLFERLTIHHLLNNNMALETGFLYELWTFLYLCMWCVRAEHSVAVYCTVLCSQFFLFVLHVLHCTLCSLPFCVPPVFLYSLYSMYYTVLSVLYRSLCSPSVPVLSVLHVLHCTLCSLPFSTVLCVPSVFLYSGSVLHILHCTLCFLPFYTVLCVPPVFLYSLYSMYYTVLCSLLFSVFPQCSCTLCTTLYSLFSITSSVFPQCYSMYYTVSPILSHSLCSQVLTLYSLPLCTLSVPAHPVVHVLHSFLLFSSPSVPVLAVIHIVHCSLRYVYQVFLSCPVLHCSALFHVFVESTLVNLPQTPLS